MTAERRTRISRLQWSCWIPAGTGRIRFGGWRNYDVQWRRWVEFHRAFHPESGRFSMCESLCDDVSETAVNGEDGELAAAARASAALLRAEARMNLGRFRVGEGGSVNGRRRRRVSPRGSVRR